MRLAIYTVLTGAKENLGNPITRLQTVYTDLKIEFICFTDNPALASDVWQCRPLDTHCLPPEKSSRRPKALPHEYLAEYDYSLYIDNICEFKRLPTKLDLQKPLSTEYVYRLYSHSTRRALIEEAIAICSLGYDTAENVINQLNTYERELPLKDVSPIHTCTVLLRQHNHPDVVRHGSLWWDHILNFSKRDQMSFDFCRIKTKLKVYTLEGTKFENDLIFAHDNAASTRQLSSFNRQEYERIVKRLAGHATPINLPKGMIERIKTISTTPPSTLEILAYLTGSSFGGFHFPKRKIASELQTTLNPLIGKTQATLGFYSPGGSAFTDYTEADARSSQDAITYFLGAGENHFYVDSYLRKELASEKATLLILFNKNQRLAESICSIKSKQAPLWLLELSAGSFNISRLS
jgi:hypothetical protein